MKRHSMKRNLIILMSLAFGLTANGCQKQSKTNKPEVKQEIKQEKGKSMEVMTLTKADFLKKVWNYEANPNEWKYLGDKPAVIDFFATWCGPCKMVSPILDELAKEYDGKIVVYKIDVDQEEELASTFGIRSIPSILMIPMKGKPQMMQGALPKNAFKEAIDKIIADK